MSILYLINTQAVNEQNVFTTDLRFCCRVEGVQSKALIKKDIHYKGDVGQSIISNKAAASVSSSTFLMATHFFSLPNLSSSIISGQMCDSKAH